MNIAQTDNGQSWHTGVASANTVTNATPSHIRERQTGANGNSPINSGITATSNGMPSNHDTLLFNANAALNSSQPPLTTASQTSAATAPSSIRPFPPPSSTTQTQAITAPSPVYQMLKQEDDVNGEEDNRAKRHAKKGQWQTPPMPIFASSSSSTIPAGTTANPAVSNATTASLASGGLAAGGGIPNGGGVVASNYVTALQEAYLRGAAEAEMTRQRIQAPAGPAAAPGVASVAGVAGGVMNMNMNMQSFGLEDGGVMAQSSTAQQPLQQPPQHQQIIPNASLATANPISAPSNNAVPNYTNHQPTSLTPPPQFSIAQSPASNSANSINIAGSIPYQPATSLPNNAGIIPIAPPPPPNNNTATNNNTNTGANTQTTIAAPIPISHTLGMQPPPPQSIGINNPLHMGLPNNTNTNMAGFHTQQQQQPQQQQQQQQQQMQPPLTTDTPLGTDGLKQPPSSSRSVSLPDLSAYNNTKMNDEEAKRVKRLARNRASARLRRLRKKNLVESYEGEVGVLENSLAKLRAHRWGVGNDPEALIEALSMDRGQQTIDSEKRKEMITSILTQQREQVRNVMDCQMENMVLGFLARYDGDAKGGDGDNGSNVKNDIDGKGDVDSEQTAGQGSSGDATTVKDAIKMEDDGETSDMDTTTGSANTESQHRQKQEHDQQQQRQGLDSLASELNDILQLSPTQKQKLLAATDGIEEEIRAIEMVDTSLSAMLSNSWLMNEGVEDYTNEFTSILNTSQMSKFMLWADHNSESIDQLDYVNAPPANAPPSQGPVFVFGMDEGMVAEDN